MNSISAWYGFELLLQIIEHPVCTFVVPQAVKQATKARFAVHNKNEKVAVITATQRKMLSVTHGLNPSSARLHQRLKC